MSISFVAACLLAAPASAEPAVTGRLVLLGARWCAPCMVEYRELSPLVAAAAPDRVELAWIDRPMAVPKALVGSVTSMTPEAARALAERVGGEGFGLPMAVYERGGRTCRVWKRPLAAGDVAMMRKGC